MSRVGRPRKLPERGVSRTFYLSSSLLAALEKVAAMKNKTVSEVVRDAIEAYLKAHGLSEEQGENAQPQQVVDPPPDPLLEVEKEDFMDALQRLEKDVEKLEAVALALQKHLAHGGGVRVLSSEEVRRRNEAVNTVYKLRQRWYQLRGWYKHLPQDKAVTERMASLLRRIQSVERALR